MASVAEINLELQPKQAVAFQTRATEVLYGGAAFGGKSHLMRVAAIAWCAAIAGLQVYIFRRVRDDLVKNHIEGPQGLRNLLAPWVDARLVEIVEDEIRFWNGSKIYLCHCKDEKDRFKYHGSEIHVLLIDELTTFTEVIYRYLRFRVRMVGLEVPEQYAGMFPRILCGSNPGNIGHAWVKRTFIDGRQELEAWNTPDEEGGMLRQYIPARYQDNAIGMRDDPQYLGRMRGAGSKEFVRAMEEGDWAAIAGAFFDGWSPALILPPFDPPSHWTRFGSFDWGSAKPHSYGLWTIAEGEPVRISGGDTIHIPRGAIVRYREWYGCQPNQPDVGLKLTAEQVADGILKVERGERIAYRVADPSIWKVDGGPSIAERMFGYRAAWDRQQPKRYLQFREADNSRINGWDQMRARMTGNAEGEPLIYCTRDCVDSIRTIPMLQHDDKRREDVDTDSEDHAADEWRYACMSRPISLVPKPKPAAAHPHSVRAIFGDQRS